MRSKRLMRSIATAATTIWGRRHVAAESSSARSLTTNYRRGGSSHDNTGEYGYPLYRLRVLFIRHGESQNNILFQVSPEHYRKNRFADPDLTDNGIQQAIACGQYLSSHSSFADFNPIMGNVEAIFVSPMLRTLRTAQPIGNALGLDPEVWTDIYEISGMHIDAVGHGGMTRSEILQNFPNYKLPSDVNEKGWYPIDRNKETRAMAIPRIVGVASRLFEMAAECLAEKKSKTIALVCHGDFKDMVLQALLGLEIPTHKRRRFLSYNTAITVVDVDVDVDESTNNQQQHATVLLQNFVGHLNSSLITHEALGIL